MQKSIVSQEMDDKKIATFSSFIVDKSAKMASGVQIGKNGGAGIRTLIHRYHRSSERNAQDSVLEPVILPGYTTPPKNRKTTLLRLFKAYDQIDASTLNGIRVRV